MISIGVIDMNKAEQKKIFVERVREQMKKHDLSQKALCERAGLKASSFSYYLNEEESRMPKGADLANLANALHTTTDWLLGTEQKHLGFPEIKTLLADSTMEMTREEIMELSRLLMFAYERREGIKK